MEAGLSPEGHDPITRAGLVHGAADFREHSTHARALHMAQRWEEVARGHTGSWWQTKDETLGGR